MSINLSALMKQRYDTAANWTAQNPTLLAGEIGIESDTKRWKIGSGSTAWTSLTYANGSTYPFVNADIAAGAEIAVSKLADGSARQLLQTDAAGTGVEWTSDVSIPGVLAVTAGTAALPGIAVSGDPNTGIYSPGADQVAISTNGTGRITVDGSGNVNIDSNTLYVDAVNNRVGIGTPGPSNTLSVDSANAVPVQVFSTQATHYLQLTSDSGGTAKSAGIFTNNDALGFFTSSSGTERARITSTGALNFVGAGTAGSTQAVSFNGSAPVNSLVIDSSGRLGIGTSGPLAKTEISLTGISSGKTDAANWGANGIVQLFNSNGAASDSEVLLLGAQSGGLGQLASGFGFGRGTSGWGTYLNFYTHSDSTANIDELTERMRITSGGNVGIGTTPAAGSLLHINSAASTDCKQQISVTTGTQAAYTAYVNTTASVIGNENSSGGSLAIGSAPYATVINNGGAYPINFATNNTLRATIDSSGRLLVGTSSASGTATLQVPGSLRAGDSGDGGNDGNNVTQVAATPPSGALMAEIFCVGNFYNGTANTHTGFYSACWSSFTNTITVIKDVNHSAGSNQGFEAIWSGTQVVVRNKTSMNNLQGGRAFIRWLA